MENFVYLRFYCSDSPFYKVIFGLSNHSYFDQFGQHFSV